MTHRDKWKAEAQRPKRVMGAVQFVGRMAERFRSMQICFGFLCGIFASAADFGGHFPAHAAPTDHRMREVSLSASRNAKDCLRNSSTARDIIRRRFPSNRVANRMRARRQDHRGVAMRK